jgi:hypothetical protein
MDLGSHKSVEGVLNIVTVRDREVLKVPTVLAVLKVLVPRVPTVLVLKAPRARRS